MNIMVVTLGLLESLECERHGSHTWSAGELSKLVTLGLLESLIFPT